MGRPAAAGAALACGHEVLLLRCLAIQLGDLAPVARLPLLDPAAHAGPERARARRGKGARGKVVIAALCGHDLDVQHGGGDPGALSEDGEGPAETPATAHHDVGQRDSDFAQPLALIVSCPTLAHRKVFDVKDETAVAAVLAPNERSREDQLLLPGRIAPRGDGGRSLEALRAVRRHRDARKVRPAVADDDERVGLREALGAEDAHSYTPAPLQRRIHRSRPRHGQFATTACCDQLLSTWSTKVSSSQRGWIDSLEGILERARI
jgi:hypothetical protein